MRISLVVALVTAVAANASGQSRYQAVWSENGETDFVRAVSDTTIMVMRVQASPYRASVTPSVYFEYYAVRCRPVTEPAWMLLAFGDTEVQALRVKPDPDSKYIPLKVNMADREFFTLSIGCNQATQRK